VQAVGVLGRVDPAEDLVLVHVLGQRELHDVAGAPVVGVEVVDRGLDAALLGVGRQLHPDGPDAHLGAVLVLAVDVPPAAWVVADEHRRQPRDDAALGEHADPLGELALDRGRCGLAVQDPCRHRFPPLVSGRSAGCR
jgi:hypothetical protein